MFELWFISFLLEGALYSLHFAWKIRRLMALTIAIIVLITSALICYQLGYLFGIPVGAIAIFRVLNMLRIVKNRMHETYLRRATLRTSIFLFVLNPTIVVLISLIILLSKSKVLEIVTYFQLFIAVCIFIIVQNNLRKLKFRMPEIYMTDAELPTITVAIPARNETTSLQECLESVLNNDYPKLEVIVLDDCSQSNTDEIIKSFAQKGVRFINGDLPAERWLAKNQAYQRLFAEASGELILFCGVDARFGSRTIRSMVNILKSRNKSMLSVLPIQSSSKFSDAFIQPMRYWWELSLPRRIFNKPPVLSTCWMIEKKVLKKIGGFGAVSNTIIPESFFARELVKQDKYSFIRSSNELELYTNKNYQQQLSTAVRNSYPKLRKKPEWVFLLSVIILVFFIFPFLFLILNNWLININPLLVSSTCLILIISHVSIVKISDPENTLIALVTFPIAAISEIIIENMSMFQYEYFTIEWKERNICIPVMHVTSRLPKV